MRKAHGIGVVAAVLLVATTTAGTAHAGAPNAAKQGKHPQRVCAQTKKGTASCDAEVMVPTTSTASSHDTTRAGTQAVPQASAPPAGALTPTQIRDAYKLTGSSGGRTVAIVDAYGYPNLENDLATYRSQYGLSSCTTANGCLKVIDQSGGRSLPAFDLGWAQETALDVDTVSAICPDCRIVVVQANSNDMNNLGAAANTAAQQPGVVAISNSYGAGDLSDATYGNLYNHPGIAVTASTGDGGFQGASYPASSSYVTAVGGTTLTQASNTRGWSESAWSGAGSGCSTVNAALPAAASSNTGCGNRAMADVSAAADPSAGGLAVYWPASSTTGSWEQVGGTSEAAPIIASVYALSGNTTGTANALPYNNSSQLFDVTSGSNGTCTTTQWCTSGTGWDGPTGLGTPNGVGAF